ncbi:NAD(P)H-dependent oxidoreductase [Termitidicoccus mucosus]|uniref:NAD(P)H-dependent oxidoreductase n=1 Tax=Termitidicoccus mucosus TaxID=1184151 RepID=A0A178IGH6_9BACT|nr:NAD(P)H-dependent oxidoreductase [Opitutaceae bacterium TSB47]
MTTTDKLEPISSGQLLAALNWRYATKQFDASKKIPADTWATLEEVLRLTPSSMGLQPWKFIVVTDPAVRARLVPVSHGQSQVADCSHLVVFTLRKNIGVDYVRKNIDRMAEVRGVDKSALAGFQQMLEGFVTQTAKNGALDIIQANQIFIALGQFTTAAALLGIDTCPLGGIEAPKYDEILGLKEKGLATLVACAAGYRGEGDKYAKLKKVRFDASEVFGHI